MQKMDLLIYKLNQDIKFPYQKVEINLGALSYKSKIQINYLFKLISENLSVWSTQIRIIQLKKSEFYAKS